MTEELKQKPPIISYEQIDYTLEAFNPAVRGHDGQTFAVEIANCQREADIKWFKQAGYDKLADLEIKEDIEAMFPELRQTYWQKKSWLDYWANFKRVEWPAQ